MSQKSVKANEILLTPQKHGISTNNKYVALKYNGHQQKFITIFDKPAAHTESAKHLQ